MTASPSLGMWTEAPRVAPGSVDEAAELIDQCKSDRATIRFVGGGSTLGRLSPDPTDVRLSSAGLSGVVAHEPDDLTVVVRAGTAVTDLESHLGEHGQTALLPSEPGRTVGGVVASGASGYARLRYGPTRDRVLGVTLVTGYGRTVRAGGALVKNVTGYDLPRLCTGSEGALGFIADVSLKLWPLPAARRTIPVATADEATRAVHRPTAVLETPEGISAFVGGRHGEVDRIVEHLGGVAEDGWNWPVTPEGDFRVAILVPPATTASAVETVRNSAFTRWVAQHGVGRIDASADSTDAEALEDLRGAVTRIGGRVVVTGWTDGTGRPDPFGFTPAGGGITGRVLCAFDPAGICNPGRLAGALRP